VAAPGSGRWVFIVKKTQANIGENLEIRSIYAAQQYKNNRKGGG
jgi:hypothetical protein